MVQHGLKGAYVGGDWVDIEDCAERFHIEDKVTSQIRHRLKCDKPCATCPRSRSSNTAQGEDGVYDVLIIGAGCIGSAIARELSKSKLSILWIDAGDDVSQGATKGNSGIVHAGYDDKPGSVKSKFCWPGNQMFPQLDEELHFGYQKNGSLVIATNEKEVEVLHDLLDRGKQNGVERLRIIQRDQLITMEPHINPNAIAALYAEDAGNLISYEFAIALAENAVDNGVELRIRRLVTGISKLEDSNEELFNVTVDHWEPKQYLKVMKQKSSSSSSSTSKMKDVAWILLLAISMILTTSKDFIRFVKRFVPESYHTHVQMLGFFFTILCLVKVSLPAYSDAGQRSTKSGGGGKPAGYNKEDIIPDSVGTNEKSISVEEMKVGGSGSISVMDGEVVEKETIKCRYIVNAAGGGSDKIAKLIGDESFYIKPRIGDYILLHRDEGHLVTSTLFPCPDPVLGKGVLCQTTLWGNLILGPTARDMHLPEMRDQTPEEIQKYILSKCKNLVPEFDASKVIHAFNGARAKCSRGDWVIEPSIADGKMIHAAGIDSPGLAASPAIAVEIVRLLKKAGLDIIPDEDFNPNRAPIIRPKNGWKGIKAGPVGKVTDPAQNVVCKCEKVTEAEVVEALLRSLPIDSTQGIRKRTRAGMGGCQGKKANYDCECRVASIIARELDIPVEAVGRRPVPATSTLPQRWLTKDQKQALSKLSENE